MTDSLNPDKNAAVSDLGEIIRSIRPVLNEGVYAYLSVPSDFDHTCLPAVGTFRETEGVTVIVDENEARKTGFEILFRAAWITLSVRSDLMTVGLTAAFSSALANAGISCNVIAAAFHDHIFVPVDMAEEAMKVLRQLQQDA